MSEEASLAKPARPKSFDPIPTPMWVRWREFRALVLPTLIFTVVAVACVWLWSGTAVNSGVAGIAEGMRSAVTAPRAATVQSVLVKPYQMVKAGDPVAIILPVDPGAELDLLQNELTLARLGLQPSLGDENVMSFERIRVELWRTKSELAIARVNLERAANQARRDAPLFHDKLLSEDLYDLSLKTRDVYAAEVFEKSNAVAQTEQRLGELQAFGRPQASLTNSAMAATLSRLNAMREQIATNWMPVTLRAPIAGMISSVVHQPGENALEGEALVTIHAAQADRVIGYLRQPYPIEPQIGMEVLMTTRERKPRRLSGAVTQVGAQVEIITNALAQVRIGALVDAGLPVAISLPPGINLRPGEIIDLTFRRLLTPEVAAEEIRPAVAARETEPPRVTLK